MTLLRQSGSYVVVGIAQLLLDWAAFVALSAAGLAVIPANLAGRVTGALLGFWLNGRYTFADHGTSRVGASAARRFVIVWLLLTLLSTVLIEQIETRLGLRGAWMLKPLLDGGLAVVGFTLSRHWIYR